MRACNECGQDAVGECEVREGVVAFADEAEEERGLRDGVFRLGWGLVNSDMILRERGKATYVGGSCVDAAQL